MSLYKNINRRKKLGISRSKKNSTVSSKAYSNMKMGFPKKKKQNFVHNTSSTMPFAEDNIRSANVDKGHQNTINNNPKYRKQ